MDAEVVFAEASDTFSNVSVPSEGLHQVRLFVSWHVVSEGFWSLTLQTIKSDYDAEDVEKRGSMSSNHKCHLLTLVVTVPHRGFHRVGEDTHLKYTNTVS